MLHSNFVHLHNHSYYSLLDGAIPLEAMIARAKEYKMPALALTDHGNMFGAIEFYQKCLASGIKPILGCECYIASRGSRKDRDPRQAGEGHYNHVTLLVKNHWRNTHRLSKMRLYHGSEGVYLRCALDNQGHPGALSCPT